MGWYIVRKKIKGRIYVYRQRTYRRGEQVLTQSQYIGPLEGSWVQAKARNKRLSRPRPRVNTTQANEPSQVNTTWTERIAAYVSLRMNCRSAVEARKVMRRWRIAGEEQIEKAEKRIAKRQEKYGEEMKKAAGRNHMKEVERLERLQRKAITELKQVTACRKLMSTMMILFEAPYYILQTAEMAACL